MLKKLYFAVLCCLLLSGFSLSGIAQTTLAGNVTDETTGEELIGVNILIKGTVTGTITDLDGTFKIQTTQELPLTLVLSLVGYETKEVLVDSDPENLSIQLKVQDILGEEVVVSASRFEEKILESPVTIEKLGIQAIKASSSPDYYDEINKLKGVHSNQASLTFNTINTRGFATAGNTRFVQLMDGMDNAAPLLNFPTGNVVGISELDINNVELVPGAASALYGPNAFNGILLMNSKNPFDYQGLSAQVKGGVTNSDAVGEAEPFGSVSVRYAKAFNNKFAFKVNVSYLTAEDWIANDYNTDRNLNAAAALDPTIDPFVNPDNRFAIRPNFDGLNKYGDEAQIFLPFASPSLNQPVIDALVPVFVAEGLPESLARSILEANVPNLDAIQITRTGFNEEDLLDNRNAESLKADAALHYRINDNLEAIYNYRYGRGSSFYQGSERYALRNFVQQFHKLELRSSNYFVRGYASLTGAGDSYNLTALGALTNETFSPSATEWVPTYAGTYAGTMVQYALDNGTTVDQLTPEQKQEAMAIAHQTARASADSPIAEVGTDEFNRVVESVRTGLFQQGGAGFIDNSRMYHLEGNYNFTEMINVRNFGLQAGGNFRQYSLFTDGTVFNEDPDGDGENERIFINEWGGYVQGSYRLADERLKLQASIRYDKNENFDGQVSPRASVVYTMGEDRNHNIRASFQTGFRNPTTQGQFIYFPTTNIIIGGSRANAERYGIYEGGAWSKSSYDQYIGALIAGTPEEQARNLLQTQDLEYVQPERLRSFEIGYKGVIKRKVLIDFNAYYNIYNNFIAEALVVNKDTVFQQGQPIAPGQTFSAYTNIDQELTSLGAAIGITYKISNKFEVSGNYSFADYTLSDDFSNLLDFDADVEGDAPDIRDFNAGFNTPVNRFNIGLRGTDVVDNFGFSVSYRWQEEFYYESSFGGGIMPAFGVLDANVSYTVPKIKSTFKIGGTNLLGDDYRTNVGNPFIGQMYFISWTYDQFLQ